VPSKFFAEGYLAMPSDPKIYDDLLVTDFGQCSEHLRHYDKSFSSNIQFGLTGFVTVLTACGWLLSTCHLSPLIAFIDGVILLAAAMGSRLVLKTCALNRWTFTTVSHYVNEIRCAYLAKRPADVQNQAHLFTDYTCPRLADKKSAHVKQLELLAVCFGLLFGLGVGAVLFAIGSLAGLCGHPTWFIPALVILIFGSWYAWWKLQWGHIWRFLENPEG
jgi:hypothetical protein